MRIYIHISHNYSNHNNSNDSIFTIFEKHIALNLLNDMYFSIFVIQINPCCCKHVLQSLQGHSRGIPVFDFCYEGFEHFRILYFLWQKYPRFLKLRMNLIQYHILLRLLFVCLENYYFLFTTNALQLFVQLQ